jgi:hypothetical protein
MHPPAGGVRTAIFATTQKTKKELNEVIIVEVMDVNCGVNHRKKDHHGTGEWL